MAQQDPTRDRLARLAGLLYLLLIPTAAPAIMGGLLAVQATPAETLAAISQGRDMFSAITLLGVVGFIDFLLLAMVFHRLFRAQCRPAADIMLAFVALSIPLSLAAMAFRLDILNLIEATGGLTEFSPEQIQNQVALSLAQSNTMMQVAVIFWGLWLLPLAQLVKQSGIAPPFLASLLTIGGVFYMVSFGLYVFDADFAQHPVGMAISSIGGLCATAGEIGLALYLLIKGDSRWAKASS